MTTIEETLTKLIELKLVSMAQAARELMDTAPGHQLSFDEKLGLIVDREWTDRDNRRLARRLKDAKLATRASLDNVLCDPERGIDKTTMRGLSSCQWIKSKHNIVIDYNAAAVDASGAAIPTRCGTRSGNCPRSSPSP